jgi:hypothetical protein
MTPRDQAAHWVDAAVRSALAQAFERHALPELAQKIARLAPITDEASMMRAEVLLSQLMKLKLPSPAMDKVLALLSHFEVLKGELVPAEARLMAKTMGVPT